MGKSPQVMKHFFKAFVQKNAETKRDLYCAMKRVRSIHCYSTHEMSARLISKSKALHSGRDKKTVIFESGFQNLPKMV